MGKVIFITLALMSVSPTVFAIPSHTGYCRYGESCEGIVSKNLREAQRICSREPFDTVPLAVYQQQRDGSVVFIGYTCVAPPSAMTE